mmetsp:Transcript_22366/g.53010  ORF Transcript_22366/g.53010 Transcript_22366/m.53010 type:complete len:404 (-) Transcript_22366:369-1580(-)
MWRDQACHPSHHSPGLERKLPMVASMAVCSWSFWSAPPEARLDGHGALHGELQLSLDDGEVSSSVSSSSFGWSCSDDDGRASGCPCSMVVLPSSSVCCRSRFGIPELELELERATLTRLTGRMRGDDCCGCCGWEWQLSSRRFMASAMPQNIWNRLSLEPLLLEPGVPWILMSSRMSWAARGVAGASCAALAARWRQCEWALPSSTEPSSKVSSSSSTRLTSTSWAESSRIKLEEIASGWSATHVGEALVQSGSSQHSSSLWLWPWLQSSLGLGLRLPELVRTRPGSGVARSGKGEGEGLLLLSLLLLFSVAVAVLLLVAAGGGGGGDGVERGRRNNGAASSAVLAAAARPASPSAGGCWAACSMVVTEVVIGTDKSCGWYYWRMVTRRRVGGSSATYLDKKV